MELDELKTAWQTLDRRLQQNTALNQRVLLESRLDKTRSDLRPLVIGQSVQIVAGVVLMLVFAPWWVEHRATFHLALCGFLLHAYGLMFVLFAARNLYLIQRLDYAAPVLDVQKRLAALRVWRVKIEAPIFGIVGCFIWVPFILVELEWVAGIDLWRSAPALVLWGIGISAACALLLHGLWRWTRRPRWAAWAAFWDNAAAGRSVQRAQAALEDIRRFEQE